jgi:thymidylate synthase (FAD)
MTNISVELIANTNSDLTVVNAARVSFSKESSLTEEGKLRESDAKLIQYLGKHNHWTTFGHCNEVYMMVLKDTERLHIYDNLKEKAGFTLVKSGPFTLVKSSLFGWARELPVFPKGTQAYVSMFLNRKYPVAAKALGIEELPLRGQTFDYRSNLTLEYTEYLTDDFIAETAAEWEPQYIPHRGTSLELLSSLTSVTLRITAPVFIRSQLDTHKVGFVKNEVSRRYVSSDPEFYEPDDFRAAPEPDPVTGKVNNKQGSSSKTIDSLEDFKNNPLTYETYASVNTLLTYKDYIRSSSDFYKRLLSNKVSAEDARMVLPQSMLTQWYWTGSLLDFARVYHLRIDAHTQAKTREIAVLIDREITKVYPKTWKLLKKLKGVS